MKEIRPIIRQDTPFWKSIRQEDDPEKAAAAAAERARKEVQERNAKREAEHQAFLNSLKYLEKLEFKTQKLRDQIKALETKREKLKAKLSEEWDKEAALQKEIQQTCTHEMCVERMTHYRDEYDDWHEGHHERKCVECFLVEESDYAKTDRYYGGGRRKYNKLENSQAVLLRKTVNGKEFELEFDDLKWSALP